MHSAFFSALLKLVAIISAQNNQTGFAHILGVLVILIGIVIGVYLATHPTVFRPHASDNITRVEVVDPGGNTVSQTASSSVLLKLTYVSQTQAFNLPDVLTQKVFAQSAVGLTTSAPVVVPGSKITVYWSGISNASTTDWIGFYSANQTDQTKYLSWFYDSSCTASAGSAVKTSGSCSFSVPSNLTAGSYQFRIFSKNSYSLLASSQSLSMSTGQSAATASLSVSSAAYVGNSTPVSWSGVNGPTVADWIGLYPATETDSKKYVNWIYTSSCNNTAGAASKASGSCNYPIPVGIAGGSYNFRLFSNNGYTLLGTSPNLVVSLSNPNAPTLVTASPSSLIPGGPLTVKWSGVKGATAKDWFGVYPVGENDNTKFMFWAYTSSCNHTPGGAPVADGSCTLTVPSNASSGGYQIKLFSNNVYTVLANFQSSYQPGPSTPTPVAFPDAFRVANDSTANLNSAQVQNFDRNDKVIPWTLSSGDGVKTIYAQFRLKGVWQSPVSTTVQKISQSSQSSNFKVGFNISGITEYGVCAYGDTSCNDMFPYARSTDQDADLAEMQKMGATVIRVFAADNRITDQQAAQRLDAFLTKAAKYNISVIVSFIDEYKSGFNPMGTDKYYGVDTSKLDCSATPNCAELYPPLLGVNDFYTSGYKNEYEQFVRTVVLQNKGHSNIFAWEPGNELGSESSFLHDIGQYIKSLDPNHKLATGTIGFTDMSQLPEYDYSTIHPYNEATPPSADSYFQSEVAKLKSQNKQLIVEEAGYQGIGDRSSDYSQSLNYWRNLGAVAYLQWGFIAKGLGDNGNGDRAYGMDTIWHCADYNKLFTIYQQAAGLTTATPGPLPNSCPGVLPAQTTNTKLYVDPSTITNQSQATVTATGSTDCSTYINLQPGVGLSNCQMTGGNVCNDSSKPNPKSDGNLCWWQWTCNVGSSGGYNANFSVESPNPLAGSGSACNSSTKYNVVGS